MPCVRHIVAIAALLLAFKTLRAQEALPSAADLLAGTRANLPQTPLRIDGEIFRGERRGKLNRINYLEAQLNLGAQPPSIAYTLRDNFGTPVRRLTITRPPEHPALFINETGNPLTRKPMPDQESFLEGADVRWQDLTLDFLWWDYGTVVGREIIMGRNCAIIEFRPPHAPRRIRLWIEEKLLILIKVAEYAESDMPQRTMTVRTLKKIGETWLIKDMDIRNHANQTRTLIRFNDVIILATD